jgi:hypothetical protein
MLVLLVVTLVQTAQAFYNPSTGRWLNRDPLGDEVFLRLKSRLQPREIIQQLRREALSPLFSFVGNEPITRADANGLLTITIPPWVWPVGVGVGLGYCIDKWGCNRHRDVELRLAEGRADQNAPDGTTHRGANSPIGGDADLLTHCIAGCELAKRPWPCFGPDGALDALQARETGNDIGTQIDRLNNEAGIGVGISVGENGNCINACLEALGRGVLTTVVNGQPAPSGGHHRR